MGTVMNARGGVAQGKRPRLGELTVAEAFLVSNRSYAFLWEDSIGPNPSNLYSTDFGNNSWAMARYRVHPIGVHRLAYSWKLRRNWSTLYKTGGWSWIKEGGTRGQQNTTFICHIFWDLTSISFFVVTNAFVSSSKNQFDLIRVRLCKYAS